MPALKSAARIMDHTTAYRLWQVPVLRDKFEPIRRHNDLTTVRRVLDVGCGPGTNCPYFERSDYLGIDVNPKYIQYARQRFKRSFQVADATTYTVAADEKFDFVLLNSLLHHIDETGSHRILNHLSEIMSGDGHIHVIDLVLPEAGAIPRYLALNDRGDFCRGLEHWREMFEASFDTVVFEPFALRRFGVTLWSLVYFKGKPTR